MESNSGPKDSGKSLTTVLITVTGLDKPGVTKALQIIHKELDLTMAFCGHTRIETVDKSILIPGTY